MTLSYSGNMALLYFDLFPCKITLNELNTAYPGMVNALVQHEGIGFVMAYEDDGDPVAFGKNGARSCCRRFSSPPRSSPLSSWHRRYLALEPGQLLFTTWMETWNPWGTVPGRQC